MTAKATDGQPSWSPDGTEIAFTSVAGPQQPHQVFVVKVDGTDRRQLTTSKMFNERPQWSGDGGKISFVHRYPTAPYDNQVFEMERDGSGQRAVGEPSSANPRAPQTRSR